MGSDNHRKLCEKFISGFNLTAVTVASIPRNVKVVAQGLRYDEVNEVVRYAIEIEFGKDGKEHMILYTDCSWYNPDLPRDDVIDQVAAMFEMSEQDAEKTLAHIGLL